VRRFIRRRKSTIANTWWAKLRIINALPLSIGAILTVSASGSMGAPAGADGPIARALARLTTREAWLTAGLAFTALATAAFFAQQWSSTERDRVAAAQADLALARQTQALAVQQRDAAGGANVASAASWSVHASNLWFARLRIEQVLHAAAAGSRLPSPQIKVAEALEGGSAAPLLKAEVSGPYVSRAWIDFMAALAASGLVYVVDKLDVSDAQASEYSLTLLVPVSLDQPPPAPGQTGGPS